MQQYPELELLYHVPNGGKRDKATATALKRQGVKAGVPDLVLPVARCGYHGLYIELKAPGGSVQKTQKEFIKRLGQQGYLAVICYGWQDTVQLIGDYLEGRLGRDAAAGAGKEAGQEAASLLLPLAWGEQIRAERKINKSSLGSTERKKGGEHDKSNKHYQP